MIDHPVSVIASISTYNRACAPWAATRSQRAISAGSGGGRCVRRQRIRNSVSTSTVMPEEMCSGTTIFLSGSANPSMKKPTDRLNTISAAMLQCSAIATEVYRSGLSGGSVAFAAITVATIALPKASSGYARRPGAPSQSEITPPTRSALAARSMDWRTNVIQSLPLGCARGYTAGIEGRESTGPSCVADLAGFSSPAC